MTARFVKISRSVSLTWMIHSFNLKTLQAMLDNLSMGFLKIWWHVFFYQVIKSSRVSGCLENLKMSGKFDLSGK